MKRWTFSWSHGTGIVQSLGGMLGPVKFDVPGLGEIQPFCIAPWVSDEKVLLEQLPPLLQNLRGEWACVPFGLPKARTDLPGTWGEPEANRSTDGQFIHGYSSNANWRLVKKDESKLKLRLEYPKSHPIRFVEREISGVDGRAALDFKLKVSARSSVDLPIGIHPVFRLGKTKTGCELSLGDFDRAYSFPVAVEPERSVFLPDNEIEDLRSVKMVSGKSIDATRLPLEVNTEELLQVVPREGTAKLRNFDEGYTVNLTWDINHFSSCLLWISNRGRLDYPWNGRFEAIGIEPVTSAFDLGPAWSRSNSNRISEDGTTCVISFTPEEPFETKYRIAVSN